MAARGDGQSRFPPALNRLGESVEVSALSHIDISSLQVLNATRMQCSASGDPQHSLVYLFKTCI